ncbi:hypothetical protein GCM10027074_01370 [Streptomyces deserti]
MAPPPVPAFAAAASTARIPATLATALHQATADLRRRLADGWRPTGPGPIGPGPTRPGSTRPGSTRPGSTGPSSMGPDPAGPGPIDRDPAAVPPAEPSAWRLWADLARGYLTLVLALLPRPRPAPALTVFIATADTLSGRPDGSASCRRLPGPQGPQPGATA